MYYAVDPEMKTPRVLLIGYDGNYIDHKNVKDVLQASQFSIVIDSFLEREWDSLHITHESDLLRSIMNNHEIDYFMILETDDTEAWYYNMLVGYCVGKDIPELTKEFYEDLKEMYERSNSNEG